MTYLKPNKHTSMLSPTISCSNTFKTHLFVRSSSDTPVWTLSYIDSNINSNSDSFGHQDAKHKRTKAKVNRFLTMFLFAAMKGRISLTVNHGESLTIAYGVNCMKSAATNENTRYIYTQRCSTEFRRVEKKSCRST